jgi:hypothetical protein
MLFLLLLLRRTRERENRQGQTALGEDAGRLRHDVPIWRARLHEVDVARIRLITMHHESAPALMACDDPQRQRWPGVRTLNRSGTASVLMGLGARCPQTSLSGRLKAANNGVSTKATMWAIPSRAMVNSWMLWGWYRPSSPRR